MRRVKSFLLPVLAILAMSFTIFAHEGLFKSKKVLNSKYAYVCRMNVDFKKVQICVGGALANYDRDAGSACPGNLGLFCATTGRLDTANTNCAGGNHFCCAQPGVAGITCPTAGCPTANTAVEVYCKP